MLLKLAKVNTGSEEFIKVRVRRKTNFRFFDVSLELESTESLQPLVKELDDNSFSSYCDDPDKQAILNLNISERNGVDFHQSYDDEKDLVGAVDVHINEFCNLIENLSAESRPIWNGCFLKEFDIGFQAGNSPHIYKTRLEAATIKRCAELGATILITVYPHLNYEFRRKDLEKPNTDLL